MTEPQPLSRTAITLTRRLAWFAIACAAASLALTIAAQLTAGSIRWTVWVLPPLVAANAAVLFLGALDRWPGLARLFLVLSLALAAAIIVSEARVLLHH